MSTEEQLFQLTNLFRSTTESFAKLLTLSEQRIDETNKMVQQLAQVSKENLEYLKTITGIYREQFNTMTTSQKDCQELNRGLLEALIENQNLMQELKK